MFKKNTFFKKNNYVYFGIHLIINENFSDPMIGHSVGGGHNLQNVILGGSM